MTEPAFKVWRVLEEKEVTDEQGHKYRTITKKECVGEIVNPKQEVYRSADGGLPNVSARAIVTSKFPRKSDGATPSLLSSMSRRRNGAGGRWWR